MQVATSLLEEAAKHAAEHTSQNRELVLRVAERIAAKVVEKTMPKRLCLHIQASVLALCGISCSEARRKQSVLTIAKETTAVIVGKIAEEDSVDQDEIAKHVADATTSSVIAFVATEHDNANKEDVKSFASEVRFLISSQDMNNNIFS